MFWSEKKSDKKTTLVFKTKSGIKRSKSQYISSEQTDSDCIENQISEHSENGRLNDKGENIDG